MKQDQFTNLDAYIANLGKLLEDALSLRKILAANPSLADVLAATLEVPPAPPEINQAKANVQRKRGRGAPTATRHYGLIISHIQALKNDWQTIADIAKAIHLKRNAVVHVLYKTHGEYFEKQASPVDPRQTVWRLREANAVRNSLMHGSARKDVQVE